MKFRKAYVYSVKSDYIVFIKGIKYNLNNDENVHAE